MVERKPMLIGGQVTAGEAGVAPLKSWNPATGMLNHDVAAAGPATVGQAVRDAARMERDGEAPARLQMVENGKVWSECMKQVRSAATTFAHRDKVAARVEQAKGEGARILAGRRRPEQAALGAGAFHLPTVIGGIGGEKGITGMRLYQQPKSLHFGLS